MTRGLKHVFTFTLKQMIKSKANLIMLAILLIAAAAAVPASSIFLGGSSVPVTGVQVNVSTMEEYLAGGELGFDARFTIQYVYSIAVLLVSVFAVSYIVRALVEEKASRLVETLMVSIHPMALIFGKILASLLFIFAEFILVMAVSSLSYTVCGMFMDLSFFGSLLNDLGFSEGTLTLRLDEAAVLLLSMILACFLFSLVAGLAGAGCASMDEIEGANMAAMGFILGGYLVSTFGAAAGSGMLMTFLILCPAVSAFTAPISYLLGDIGLGTLVFSWGLEVAVIVVLLLLTSRVYDRLILYKGSRLKLGQIVRMALPEQKGGR